MKPSGLLFLFQEGFYNIRRNGLMSLATLGTVTVALTVLGAMLWTAHRINEYAALQPQKFNQIDLFLNVAAEREQAEALKEKVAAIPGVKTVRLIPKERAWAQMQTDEPQLTQAVEENPLPDKLEVEADKAGDAGNIARLLRDRKQFPLIAKVNDASEEVRTMLGMVRLLRVVGGFASVGLFVATLFLVQNTIRLTVFARRREIHIMQLVGATPGFIRFPMLLEGLFHGVVGACIAGSIVLLCGREVSRFVSSLRSPLLMDVPTLIGPKEVWVGMLLLGAFIGLAGSLLSMRRFLRQI
jgi:cell division transport system permease protein